MKTRLFLKYALLSGFFFALFTLANPAGAQAPRRMPPVENRLDRPQAIRELRHKRFLLRRAAQIHHRRHEIRKRRMFINHRREATRRRWI